MQLPQGKAYRVVAVVLLAVPAALALYGAFRWWQWWGLWLAAEVVFGIALWYTIFHEPPTDIRRT